MSIKKQGTDQVVQVADWQRDEDSGEVFPEGSREKKLLLAPETPSYDFIVPKHRYLFKLSDERYPEQFWGEIIAYKIALIMGIEVPPAFVTVDEKNNKTGVLIEWFLKHSEAKVSGSAYMQRFFKNYDLKKGTQHNFHTIRTLHTLLAQGQFSWNFNWAVYWAQTLLFDTLIGNTDRHQDNWGIIWQYKENVWVPLRMTPVFDNGTSMGHEILERNFDLFSTKEGASKYISRGRHHMKWDLVDQTKINQIEFLQKIIQEYPETKNVMLDLIKIDMVEVENAIIDLTKFKVPCPLSIERAKFIYTLLSFRQKNIVSMLGS